MGETDISGLRLLEAQLGLDWAAEGLDLTSSNTGSSYPYMYSYSSPRHLSLYTGLGPTKLATLSLHRSYVGFTVLQKIYLLAGSTHTQIAFSSAQVPSISFHYAHSFSSMHSLRACCGKAVGQTFSGWEPR